MLLNNTKNIAKCELGIDDIRSGCIAIKGEDYEIYLEPNDNKMIVRKLVDELISRDGIMVPRSEVSNEGIIVEVFLGFTDSGGKIVKPKYNIGDIVVVREFAGDQLKIPKYKNCFVVSENDVQCVYRLRPRE